MEQPLSREKKFFSISPKVKEETKSFLKLAAPMFGSQVALQLIGINSVIQSGNYSSEVLAGILMANGLYWPLMFGLGGVIFFVTPMVAQLFGANKLKEIGPLVRQAMWLVIPIVLFIMILLGQASKLLVFVGVEEGIIKHTDEYLSMFIFAIPPIMLSQPLRSLSEGITRPRPIMYINIGMLVMAVIGNYCFIYGNWGFPEMGARGAGLSAIIGTWTALFTLIFYVWWSKNYKSTEFFSRFDWPSLRVIKDILRGGIPLGLSNFFEIGMFSGSTLILGSLGSQVVAAHGIALNIGGLLFMVPMSIGLAAAVRVGNKVGEQDFKGARYSSFYAVKFGTSLGLINSFLLLLFAELIVSSIFTDDQAVISTAVVLLMFAALFQVADAVAMCGMGSLRGYKDTFGPMLIVFVAYWLIGLPFGYSLAVTDTWAVTLGAAGMWSGMCIGLIIAASCMLWRLNVTTNKYLVEKYES
jgi:MATE family multidrug resistance protein